MSGRDLADYLAAPVVGIILLACAVCFSLGMFAMWLLR